MAQSCCRVPTPLLFLDALIGIVAAVPSSLSGTESTMPGIAKRAANGKNLAAPNPNTSLPQSSMVSAESYYHISGTPVDLGFTFFGPHIRTGLLFQTFKIAIDKISANLSLRPAETIENGFFQQRHNDIEINIYEYSGEQVTWSTLNQLMLGIQYFTRSFSNSRVLEFEIDISGIGRAGYGSLRYSVAYVPDLAERVVVGTSLQKLDVNISQPLQNDSSQPLLLPTFEEEIIFSLHFFGRAIPEAALSTSFRLVRHVINNNVRLHPNDNIEGGIFRYTPDRTRVEFVVKADTGNELTWLLLDRVLARLAVNRWSQHIFREFDFEFELHPFEESYGHGSVRYLL